jgi:hypothetical protein
VFEVTGGTGPTLVVGGSSRTTENAVLEVKQSSNRTTVGGFMFPQVTDTQRSGLAVTSSDVGLIVYQTNGDEGLYIYKSGGWVQII